MEDCKESGSSFNYFKEPIRVSELIENGCQFEMNIEHNVYTDEVLEDFDMDSDEDETIDHTKLPSPWTESYEQLKKNMVKINSYMWKLIVKRGDEHQPMPGPNYRVTICYNAYWEGESVPFDSTYLRRAPYRFCTGCNEVLEGLEIAVTTMHPGEESHFIICYPLLFGEVGCPPRIKPKADGLYTLRLLSCNKVGDENAEQMVPTEDRSKFSKIHESVLDIKTKAKDFFMQKMYGDAIRTFNKAVSILRYCHVADEKEEKGRRDLLVTIYTNLAVCYNRVEDSRKCCIMCREIQILTYNQPPVKALFQEGRALLRLSDYERAFKVLKRAQKMSPSNVDINNELKVLNERYSNYKNDERQLCSRALKMAQTSKDINQSKSDLDDSKLEGEMRQLLIDFKNDESRTEFKLPSSLTAKEIKNIKHLTELFKLKLRLNTLDRKYVITKVNTDAKHHDI